MKKILFSMAFSALFMGLNAQNVLVERTPSGGGFLSMDPVETPIIASADFFVIDEEVALGELSFHGEFIDGGDPANEIEGLGIYIYENGDLQPVGYPDQPGTGLVELPNIPLEKITIEEDEDNPTNLDLRIITVPLTEANDGEQIILQPGNYWLVVTPKINNPFSDFPNVNLWYWSVSFYSAPIGPQFYDPSNAAGAGATDWTPIANFGTFPSFAWTLTDEEKNTMGISENLNDVLTVYPNPVNDILNINSKTAEIKDITLYDLTGKIHKADFNGQTVNVSNLPTGVYILKIETEKGIVTKKIIKN